MISREDELHDSLGGMVWYGMVYGVIWYGMVYGILYMVYGIIKNWIIV